LCFASTLENNRNKLDPRANRCIFLGFKVGTKDYIVIDAQTREIFVFRNVLFYEKNFCQVTDKSEQNKLNYDQNFMEYMFESPHDSYHRGNMNEVANTKNKDVGDLKRSTRSRRSPTYLEDYHHQLLTSSEKVINTGTTRYALNLVLLYKNLSNEHFNYYVSLFLKTKPHTYEEAVKSDKWKATMNDDIKALEINNTWMLVDLPEGKTPIGCKWVYKIKRRADGNIERYKARLVAKGYTQREVIDFFETYSPVAKLTTIHMILAIAAIKDWHPEHLDVDNTFLHGDLTEEVYMEVPSGIINAKPNQVCHLTKSLYALKQASRQWYEKLASYLLTIGFIQSQADNSLFIKKIRNFFYCFISLCI